MKKALLMLAVCFLFIGCGAEKTTVSDIVKSDGENVTRVTIKGHEYEPEFVVINIDKCEYLYSCYAHNGDSGMITHKGNCKSSFHKDSH